MNFAKYYKVTDIVKELEGTQLLGYEGQYRDVFICNDTHVFWVARVQEDIDSDMEYSPGTFIVEREKYDKMDFAAFLAEQLGKELPEIADRYDLKQFIFGQVQLRKLLGLILLMDDEQGLSSWEVTEFDSYEDCLEAIDDGSGILTI